MCAFRRLQRLRFWWDVFKGGGKGPILSPTTVSSILRIRSFWKGCSTNIILECFGASGLSLKGYRLYVLCSLEGDYYFSFKRISLMKWTNFVGLKVRVALLHLHLTSGPLSRDSRTHRVLDTSIEESGSLRYIGQYHMMVDGENIQNLKRHYNIIESSYTRSLLYRNYCPKAWVGLERLIWAHRILQLSIGVIFLSPPKLFACRDACCG